MKILITGELRIGKSALINKVISDLNKHDLCGFRTLPVIENEQVTGHKLQAFSGEVETFAHINFKINFQFGKFGVRNHVFDKYADLIKHDLKENKWLVIDELGLMEKYASKFIDCVTKTIMDHDKVLVTVQRRALKFWIEHFGVETFDSLFVVKENNRELLPDHIRRLVSAT